MPAIELIFPNGTAGTLHTNYPVENNGHIRTSGGYEYRITHDPVADTYYGTQIHGQNTYSASAAPASNQGIDGHEAHYLANAPVALNPISSPGPSIVELMRQSLLEHEAVRQRVEQCIGTGPRQQINWIDIVEYRRHLYDDRPAVANGGRISSVNYLDEYRHLDARAAFDYAAINTKATLITELANKQPPVEPFEDFMFE